MNIENKLVGQMTLQELIVAFKSIFPTKEDLREALEDFVTKDEFRETSARLSREIRGETTRVDRRVDDLELGHGKRITQTEDRLLTVKKVIQEDLGAKVAWQ